METQNLSKTAVNIHEELIEACRKNSRKAQLQLYKMYYKAMYNTALRIVGHTAEAEDVMQESFLAGFRKIGDYKGDASFGAWLKKIVVHAAIDQLKKKKEQLSLEESGIEPLADEPSENYLEVLSYKTEQIRVCIEKLGEDDRVILSLFLLEGYDHEEISHILGISNNASRTRYSRARQRLRELLNQNKIDELVN